MNLFSWFGRSKAASPSLANEPATPSADELIAAVAGARADMLAIIHQQMTSIIQLRKERDRAVAALERMKASQAPSQVTGKARAKRSRPNQKAAEGEG